MRIHVTQDADQREAAIQLLTLCGGILHGGSQNGRPVQDGGQTVNLTQNGRGTQDGVEYDVLVGSKPGEVNSKWVFDSVASARMRTTRRYINMNSFSELQSSLGM